jgi:hypothetical protein
MKGEWKRFSLPWSSSVRRVEALVLLLLFAFVSGCGSEANGIARAQEGRLRPGKINSEVSYEFEAWVREEIFDEKEELLWTNHANLLGRFDFKWKGYSQVEGHGEKGRFSYKLKLHRLEQSSNLPEMNYNWEENYGGEKPVEMVREGVPVDRPMGNMGGDPRDSFLEGESEAWVSPWGEAFRLKGRLPQARYHRRSGPIGQYFFKGLRVEEWAHACFISIPPDAWDLKNRGTGVRKVIPVVQVPGKEDRLEEVWKAQVGENQIIWQTERRQSLPIASAPGLTRAVKDWTQSFMLRAKVDSKTGLAKELSLNEKGGYSEAVLLGRKATREEAPPWIHSRYQYSFKAHRP